MDGEWMYELTFAPHNPESMGFNGRMYIPKADSVPYVKHLSMQVPKAINLNYVRNLYVVQDFERDADGTRHKVKDDMTVEVELIPGMQPLYARRATAYQNFSDSLPPDAEYFNQSAPLIVLADAQSRDKDFWQEKRLVPVHEKELGVKALLAMLRKHKWFRITEKAVGILVSGYVGTGNPSKVDLGPVNTLISANTAEGARFRVGGMTTAHLSKHWFARGYAAYGTRDRKFKYGGELEYSFLPKKYHSREFPRHSIMLSHSYDMDHLGQHYLFTNSDNVFLSLKRKEDDKVTYRRLTDLNYILELHNGFSLQAGVKWSGRSQPAGCRLSTVTAISTAISIRAPSPCSCASLRARLSIRPAAIACLSIWTRP